MNKYDSIFFLLHRNADNYQKLNRVLYMMSFFGLREWKFCNKNIDQLATLLKSQHKQIQEKKANGSNELIRSQNGITSHHSIQKNCIPNGHRNAFDIKRDNQLHNALEFDMRTIDWNEYFFHYLPGIKKYFFKETVTKKCVAHYRRYDGLLHAIMQWIWINCLVFWVNLQIESDSRDIQVSFEYSTVLVEQLSGVQIYSTIDFAIRILTSLHSPFFSLSLICTQ